MNSPAGPDERALRAHIQSPRFTAGADAGRWRVIKVEWPIVLVAVSAAAREGSPSEYYLRLTVDGYPGAGITATPWDTTTNAQLAEAARPAGVIAGWVFRVDWNAGTALYAPWDRTAMPGHVGWASTHPGQIWTPQRDLTFFLECVWEVLNADDYKGSKASQTS